MGTYFNLRGRAEPTRLILAQAGAEYEEVRIPWGGFTPSEEWLKVKPSVPMGQVPFMEVDGKMICQSMAIARYCAKKYGLAGATDLEAALADRAVDAVEDLIPQAVDVLKEKDDAKKPELLKELQEVKIPAWLVMMEKVLKAQVSNGQKIVFDKSSQFAVQGGEYFTGVSLSWADLVVYNL